MRSVLHQCTLYLFFFYARVARPMMSDVRHLWPAVHSWVFASHPRVYTTTLRSCQRDADPAFFNTLFVSLGIAFPPSSPPSPSSDLFSFSSWMCSYGRVLSDPWRSRRASTIGPPDRPFVLVVAHPRRTHDAVDEAYTGIRADTLTTRLVGTSAD